MPVTPPTLTRNTFVFQGHEVRYFTAGRGKPVVFLHNGGNDHRVWDFQLERFSRNHAVYALDHLGYGQSDKPEVAYSLDLYSSMLAGFLAERGLESVTLVGNCVGSAMSLHHALQTPEKIAGLVLFNVLTAKTLSYGRFGGLSRAVARAPVLGRILRRAARRLVLPAFSRTPVFRMQYGTTFSEEQEFVQHLHELYDDPHQIRVLLSLLLNLRSYAALDELVKPARFPPVCLIWGAQNAILPSIGEKELSHRLRPDQVWVVADCGHLVMRERHEEVSEYMDVFMQRHEGG
ncbi:alpha/beta fold hydrolase [Planctomycetota bacterium]